METMATACATSTTTAAVAVAEQEIGDAPPIESNDINTLADCVAALQDMGYHARLDTDGESVTGGISITIDDDPNTDDTKDFIFMLTENDGSLQFDCQLCTIGDLPGEETDTVGEEEAQISALALIFLAVNTEIQPFSVGLINPDGILDETDVLVLTNSVPMGNLNRNEFQSAMDGLRRGLVAVIPSLIS